MKHLLALFITMAALLFVACNDEPEVAPTKLPLLESDSLALVAISKALDTDAEGYPVRWSPADRSTWKEIRLDTITDEATGKQSLAVGSITIYLTHEGLKTPYDIKYLSNLKELRIYGCAGSIINPRIVPAATTTLLIDRLHPTDKGYILLDYGLTVFEIPYQGSVLFNVTIHGLKMKSASFWFDPYGNFDMSDNTLEGEVPYAYRICRNVNLSHNNYTVLQQEWNAWRSACVPDLKYNDIEIPADIFDTAFWRENHEKFIGNPGYRAPAE